MLVTCALALTACNGSTPSTSAGIDLPRLGPELRKSHAPVKIPDQPLSKGQTETLWGADRASLVMCEASRTTLVTYNDVLAAGFAGAKTRK